jgi:hypothetical protein
MRSSRPTNHPVEVVSTQASSAQEIREATAEAYKKGQTPGGLCMGLTAFLGAVVGVGVEIACFYSLKAWKKAPSYTYSCAADPFGGGVLVHDTCRNEDDLFTGYAAKFFMVNLNKTALYCKVGKVVENGCMYFADGPYFPANISACNTHPCFVTDPDIVDSNAGDKFSLNVEDFASWWSAIPAAAIFLPVAIEAGVRIHNWTKVSQKKEEYRTFMKEQAQRLALPAEIIADLALYRIEGKLFP